MLKIGLTGGIGSGKTTVAKIFELLRVPVYNADAASRELYHTDKELKAAMIHNFGADIYEHGRINRARLAELVFHDPEKTELLNSLVHPPTIRHAEAWMNRQQAPYVIKEAALIFESGSSAGLDYVIGVEAPLPLRIQRIMERDGATREAVLHRMDRQIDEVVKMKLCDFIIRNDEQHLVIPQVIALHEHLLQRAAQEVIPQ
ncbi:MAG TPA: dephospho-CoA kinase [Flavisolibacter sp.]